MKNQKVKQLTDAQFFIKASDQIKKICQNSIQAQILDRKIKKINALKDQKIKVKDINANFYIKNLVIDYLRANNFNYSYSVLIKQCDILSSEVTPKSQLISFFELSDFDRGQILNISVIELLLQKIATLDLKKSFNNFGIQVQLLKNDHNLNSVVLKQAESSMIRKEVQQRQKKHYQNMLGNMKKFLTTSIKQDLKKQYEIKIKETKAQYQRQVSILKQKNKQFLVNNPKLNPKIQEYLKTIQQLQTKNMNITLKLKELQKQKIQHNCFKMPKIIQKEKQLSDLKKELNAKRQEYQFALKTINTSIHNIALDHKNATQPSKNTDLFLQNLKNRANTKQYMIDEMYRRMMISDKRIQSLSKDNQSLRELNRQLNSKISQLQELNTKLRRQQKPQESENKVLISPIKPVVKNISISVTQQQIFETLKPKNQHIIDEIQSQSQSSEDEKRLERITSLKLTATNLKSQLQINKNKIRYLIEDFN